MGYSICTKFPNNMINQMFDFLDANQSLLNEFKKAENGGVTVYPKSREGLGYAPKGKNDNLVGFNGSSIPTTLWALTAWMSVKSPYRDKEGNAILYYDHEKMAVEINKPQSNHFNVDQDGIFTKLKEESLEAIIMGKRKHLQVNKNIQKLIQELDNRWQEYIHQPEPEAVKSTKKKPKI